MKTLIALAVLLLTGCSGPAQNAPYARLDITRHGGSPLSIGVQDRRPYVVTHDKGQDFVGIYRGNFGIPVPIINKTGEPLALDMARSLGGALGGLSSATTVPLSPEVARSDVVHALQASGAKRLLLLTLHDWKFDTFHSARLFYDIDLEALDADGKVLAIKSAKGVDDIGGSFFLPINHAVDASQEAFKTKIEALYQGEIAAALHGS